MTTLYYSTKIKYTRYNFVIPPTPSEPEYNYLKNSINQNINKELYEKPQSYSSLNPLEIKILTIISSVFVGLVLIYILLSSLLHLIKPSSTVDNIFGIVLLISFISFFYMGISFMHSWGTYLGYGRIQKRYYKMLKRLILNTVKYSDFLVKYNKEREKIERLVHSNK
jgi:hypothetical protein